MLFRLALPVSKVESRKSNYQDSLDRTVVSDAMLVDRVTVVSWCSVCNRRSASSGTFLLPQALVCRATMLGDDSASSEILIAKPEACKLEGPLQPGRVESGDGPDRCAKSTGARKSRRARVAMRSQVRKRSRAALQDFPDHSQRICKGLCKHSKQTMLAKPPSSSSAAR